MKISELKTYLEQYAGYELRFILPDGDLIPAHAHITEAGRVDKRFIDCGATIRQTSACTLQAWVSDDIDHRLAPGRLAAVLDIASPLFRSDDLDVEIEYEECAISQFPVLDVIVSEKVLSFQLGSKHTDCLAKDVCLPQNAARGGSGCC